MYRNIIIGVLLIFFLLGCKLKTETPGPEQPSKIQGLPEPTFWLPMVLENVAEVKGGMYPTDDYGCYSECYCFDSVEETPELDASKRFSENFTFNIKNGANRIVSNIPADSLATITLCEESYVCLSCKKNNKVCISINQLECN